MATLINADTTNGLKLTSDLSGEVDIQSNGTTIATVDSTGLTMASGKVVLGGLYTATAQASTTGTSIDFTGIPSNAKRITVMLTGVSTNGTSVVQAQIGDSGGIETTGYQSAAAYGTTLATQYGTSTTGYMLTVGTGDATNVITAVMTLVNLDGNIWVESMCSYPTSSGLNISGAGTKTLTGTLDRVRVTTANGTDAFDAGSINIMYE